MLWPISMTTKPESGRGDDIAAPAIAMADGLVARSCEGRERQLAVTRHAQRGDLVAPRRVFRDFCASLLGSAASFRDTKTPSAGKRARSDLAGRAIAGRQDDAVAIVKIPAVAGSPREAGFHF